MKISNETKIGALTITAITLMVLGFNFLKGKTFFGKSHNLFAKYTNVMGLANSNPVMINGMQVGTVYSISTDKNMKEILVNMMIDKDVNIPTNSYATIKTNPLGTTSIDIKLGDGTTYLPKNGTIQTAKSAGMLDGAVQEIRPVLRQVNSAVHSLDSVLQNVNSIVDPNSKQNIRSIIENLNRTTSGLVVSSSSLQSLLNTQTGTLAKSLSNVSSFSGNLAGNNDKLSAVMDNLNKTTNKLSELDIKTTLSALNETVAELKNTILKLNSDKGTAGLLLNDTKLYNNLTATSNKLNLLLDDLKTNPKRYISFSVFGKKDKGLSLSTPLPDTVNAPYLNKK